MLKRKTSAAWTAPLMLQAALLWAPLASAEDQKRETQILPNPVTSTDSSQAAVDDEDGADDEVRSNREDVRKTRVVQSAKKREVAESPAKEKVLELAGRRLKIQSADGKTFEIIAPELHALSQKLSKEAQPGKAGSVGRAITILRSPDGEQQIVDREMPQIVDLEMPMSKLIGDLTLSLDQAAQAPRFVIGVSVSEAPESLMAQLGREGDSAVVVDSVVENSPAERAGVKKHDVILKVAGEAVRSAADLTKAVRASDGKAIELVLLRAGKELKLEVAPRQNEPVRATTSDGMIHFGPGVMLSESAMGRGPLLAEIKALRADVAELKKMIEELKAEK